MVMSSPGVEAVPLGLTRLRTPAPQTEAPLSNSGKELNLSLPMMQWTANTRAGSVTIRISRMDQRKVPSSVAAKRTGPFGRSCDGAQATGSTSKSGRRNIGEE
jgi:hypothetical protein